MATDARLTKVSHFIGYFRGFFMPAGLCALVAIGVHAAADLVDDHLLSLLDFFDAWADRWLAKSDSLANWVDRIGPLERTIIARSLAVAWELLVDAVVALPQLGYSERGEQESKFSFRRETWRTLFTRVNSQPTPARVLRPALTLVFAAAGAYAIARLVESTAFFALHDGVVSNDTAEPAARVLGLAAVLAVLASHGWRTVLRALEYADGLCVDATRRTRSPWRVGLIGSVLALPLAVAVLLEAHNLLALVR